MASGVGGFCLMAFGQVPWCLFIGTCWIGLHPLYWIRYSMWHIILLLKNDFRWIPLPLVEEVYNHLWEMLEAGTIQSSQSAWCNVVVLFRKKDGGLHFCIDFNHLNAHTKKDSYPLPRIQEALGSLVGAGHFSCLDLKLRFLANKNGGGIETVYCLYGRQFGVFQMWPHALWAIQCASHISVPDAKLSHQIKPHLLSLLT